MDIMTLVDGRDQQGCSIDRCRGQSPTCKSIDHTNVGLGRFIITVIQQGTAGCRVANGPVAWLLWGRLPIPDKPPHSIRTWFEVLGSKPKVQTPPPLQSLLPQPTDAAIAAM